MLRTSTSQKYTTKSRQHRIVAAPAPPSYTFFLERQLKCKRQCFCASAPSRRKWRICKPQTELFWPRPLQCKVQTLLLWASVQGLWWKQQHITFPFHCFSINLCSSPPRQAKPSYLLLLHHRVSYFLHSLQTIAMMIKICEHPLSPWPFGFHTTLMGNEEEGPWWK